MVKQRVKFTFPGNLITEPVIYQLGHEFHVVTNIRRADVRDEMGWVILEIEGEEAQIQQGLKWVSSTGVQVYPISGDVVEG
jgi:ABC-type methionine transport system ATPase subunit